MENAWTDFFETQDIYKVDPESGLSESRSGSVDLVDRDLNRNNLRWPFWVTGIERHDLAVHAASIDFDGVDEHYFLVVSSSQGQGKLVTPEFIENLGFILTAKLAKKITTLSKGKLEKLSIDSLVMKIEKRFPGMRGFVR